MNPELLAEDGRNLASVLMGMAKMSGLHLSEVRCALARAVPGLTDLQVQQHGGFVFVRLRRNSDGDGSAGRSFDLSQESDGTVRLLGLLTALYQYRPPPLTGIEEPELTVHPGALQVLGEVMVEAAGRTQILATTHSPDLIDRLPIEGVKAVRIQDGSTEVGPISQAQASAVEHGLFTLGELHSMEGVASN